MPDPSGSYFGAAADVYAPDDAAMLAGGHMLRTQTDIQRLEPGSNVPAQPGAPNALVAAAAIIAIIAAVHYFFGKGGRRR